jgi:hypothetical protein
MIEPRVYIRGAHMIANNIFALHEMADNISLDREQFQKDGAFPHYVLTKSKYELAVAHGCVEISMSGFPDDVLLKAEDGGYQTYAERKAKVSKVDV